MANPDLNNSLLRRYWIETKVGFGFGVTAYSVDDARHLLDEETMCANWDDQVLRILEDVDIRDLDQDHVIPNMGLPNLRGVWFPNLNLRETR